MNNMKILLTFILLTKSFGLVAQDDVKIIVHNYYEENIKPNFCGIHEQQVILEQWKEFCNEKIALSESKEDKRAIVKLFVGKHLSLTGQFERYDILLNYDDIYNLYSDDVIVSYIKQRAMDIGHNYGGDHYHQIISLYKINKEIDRIREYNCFRFVENEQDFILSRLNNIIDDFKLKREVSKPSLLFLKDLIVLSNFETNSFYSETIIDFIKKLSDILQEEESSQLDYLFSNLIISKVLSANINIDVLINTMYLLDYPITKPEEEYLTYRWSLIIDNYFNTLVLPNLKKTSDEFKRISRVKQTEYLNSYDLNEPIEFTWTKYLYKAIENNLVEWHFYMK